MHNRARHRYKATSRTKRDGHKPRQQPCAAAAPLPSTGRLSEAAPVPRAGFSRVPCTESPGGRLSAERQRGPEHPPRPRFEEPRPSKPPPHSPRRRAAARGFSGEHFPCASRCNGLIKALGQSTAKHCYVLRCCHREKKNVVPRGCSILIPSSEFANPKY